MKKRLCAVALATTVAFSATTAFAAGITLKVNNGNIKDVIAAVSSISGRSVVTDDSVQGTVTVDLNDVSFDTAMNIITASKGLSYKNIDGVVVVSTADQMKKNLGNIEVFKLHYAVAEDIQNSLKDLLTDGKITIDPVTNSILVSGTQNDIARVSSAIKQLDVATQQVTLEAKIISISKSDSKNLGINWGWDNIPRNTEDSNNDDDEQYGGVIRFGRSYEFRFSATLNALFANGKAKILATPRIITIPGRQASIFIGDSIPVTTEKVSNGENTYSTEYVDAGIKLEYTPIVSADGMITSKVLTEVSTPTLVSELKNYRITSRTANTNVRMRNGETLIIGGLINEEEQRNIQKVPLLSKIPIFGELFKSRSRSKDKTEIIIILTPYLTDAGDSPAIYDTSSLNEFNDFSDKKFIKDIKNDEAKEARTKLNEELEAANKVIKEADAKRESESMQERVQEILNN